MFEDQTTDAIRQRMLDDSPQDIDRRQGSVTWDLISPAAIQLARLYIDLDYVLTQGFVDTATDGAYIDYRASEYGIERKEAEKATGSVTFTGPIGTLIPAGTRVSTGGLSPLLFETTEDVTISSSGTAVANAVAVEGGAAGNVGAGAIRAVVGDLSGVVTVTNDEPFAGGTDRESDDELRNRVLERARNPATSGNAAHYRQWALEVPGISDARVTPVWDGPGTVRVVLLADDKTAPDPSIIADATAHIESQRPVGADVTVVGATEVPINISATLTLEDGYDVSDVQPAIEANIVEYLAGLAFVDDTVRYSKIANALLDVEGVLDYANLTVNGGTSNITVADDAVAVLGTVSLS